MSKALITESILSDISAAIRLKLDSGDYYRPVDMAEAILSIEGQSNLVAKTITQNGTYDPADDNADGYSGVTVNVATGVNGYTFSSGALHIWAVANNGVTLVQKSISANGTYLPSSDSADGYSQVIVAVPNTYAAGDEGKVVDDGALVAQTSRTVTANGTYDTTTNDEVVVEVEGTISAGDEGKVVVGGELVEQTNRRITENRSYDTTANNVVVVEVPNSYTAADEGKVVDNGALAQQTSLSITENGTYDTTKKSSVVVDVEGGEAELTTKSINANGTYAASADNADGYSSVTVNVPNSYAAADEGKVVYNGALASQTTKAIAANGSYDTTRNDAITVNVPDSPKEFFTVRTVTRNGRVYAFISIVKPDKTVLDYVYSYDPSDMTGLIDANGYGVDVGTVTGAYVKIVFFIYTYTPFTSFGPAFRYEPVDQKITVTRKGGLCLVADDGTVRTVTGDATVSTINPGSYSMSSGEDACYLGSVLPA